jgi:hypothetical protein
MTAITTGVQTDTATGAITGTADGDGVTTFDCVEVVFTLTAGTASIALEDTADDFTAAKVMHVFHVKGATPTGGVRLSVKKRDLAGIRFGSGTDGTGLRFNVVEITGGGTLTTHGWYN